MFFVKSICKIQKVFIFVIITLGFSICACNTKSHIIKSMLYNHDEIIQPTHNKGGNSLLNGSPGTISDEKVNLLDLRKTSLQGCNRGLLSCNTAQFNKACVTQVDLDLKKNGNIYPIYTKFRTILSIQKLVKTLSLFTFIFSLFSTSVEGLCLPDNNTHLQQTLKDYVYMSSPVTCPNASAPTSFKDVVTKYGCIENWCTTNITDMSYAFDLVGSWKEFNENISIWDVSNVVNMSHMFENQPDFNQNLSSWEVSKVTDMSWMFYCLKIG